MDISIYLTSFAAALDGLTKFLLIILFYIGPFFFIPMLMQRAGGMFATLTGAINDKSKGLFDRNKNWRANKRKDAMGRTKEGNRFRGKGAFRDKLNKGMGYASNFSAENAGIGMNPKSWRPSSIKSAMQSSYGNTSFIAGGKAAEQSQAFQILKADEDLVEAGIGTSSKDLIRQRIASAKGWDLKNLDGTKNAELERGVANVLRAQRDMGREAFDQQAVVAAAGTTGGLTLKRDKNGIVEWERDAEGNYVKDEDGNYKRRTDMDGASYRMLQLSKQAAGDNRMIATQVAMAAKKSAGSIGRWETASLSNSGMVENLNAMYANKSEQTIRDALKKNYMDNVQIQNLPYGKDNSIVYTMNNAVEKANEALAAGNDAEANRWIATIAAIRDSSATASTKVRDNLVKALSTTAAGSDGTKDIAEIMFERMDNASLHPSLEKAKHFYTTGERRRTTPGAGPIEVARDGADVARAMAERQAGMGQVTNPGQLNRPDQNNRRGL